MRLDDLKSSSMHDLFRQEAESQIAILNRELLALENDAKNPRRLEALMRAAHSIKGAARILNLDLPVKVAHAMEDAFVAAQKGEAVFDRGYVDALLACVDALKEIAAAEEADVARWQADHAEAVNALLARLAAAAVQGTTPRRPEQAVENRNGAEARNNGAGALASAEAHETPEARVVRVSANHLDSLLKLVGESLVESRSLGPFSESLLRFKRIQENLFRTLDALRQVAGEANDACAARAASLAQQAWTEAQSCRQALLERQEELDQIVRRSTDLAHRLYHETHTSRMRPFRDCAQNFPRMVRDLAHSLGKKVRLEITGEDTLVDRDILEKLDAPLTQLIRNAVDHGLESPEERAHSGKPSEGVVRLQARHAAGWLLVELSDDGRGIALETLRDAVIEKKLATPETAARLNARELLEFLFLPGFSLARNVSEVSGRGVGLDIVQSMARGVRGSVQVESTPGAGTRFELRLPLTLSVIRALIVQIGGEPYALPLGQMSGTLNIEREQVQTLEGRQYFVHRNQRIGLVSGASVLELPGAEAANGRVPIVLLGDGAQSFGIAVEKFLGERELVVQVLDARLGKVKNISAGSILPDGAPVLIIDVEDFIRSVELLVTGGRIAKVEHTAPREEAGAQKRVLVVDDSLTVRELERKLLGNAGYQVEVAVDGMDGWNAARSHPYDLIITDVDMPRLDGIELVSLVRRDSRLKSLPVMIVSYKDREEDRRRGLDAGADYYFTKGSFKDDALVEAVANLIGKARS